MAREIPITTWILSGIIGALVRDTYSFIVVKLLGWTKYYIWNWGAILFLKESSINTLGGTIIGFTADFMISSILAITICALIDWQRQQHYLIYGLGIGMGAWLLFYGIFLHGVIAALKNAPTDVPTNLIAIFGHAIFGLVTAFAYVKLNKGYNPKWK